MEPRLKLGVALTGLLLVLLRLGGVRSLRNVQLVAPGAVRLGSPVQLSCRWSLDANETLYSVKWYRGRQEFFSYLPKEYPFTRIFPQPGIDVDVSRSSSQQVSLRAATRALAGRFRCEVSADAPSFHTQVRSAVIHVVELPEDKPTLKAEKSWYAIGDSLRARCTSPPADPPANLTWLLNDKDVTGLPIIQQRILPTPGVALRAPAPPARGPPARDPPAHAPPAHGPPAPAPTLSAQEANNNLIFSPWKTFGPFVDNVQDGDVVQSPDGVVLPSTEEPPPTAPASNKTPSVSQLSFIVRSDSFERGQLRLACVARVHGVYSERADLVINEERPQIASVLSTRDSATDLNRASLALSLLYSSIIFVKNIMISLLR